MLESLLDLSPYLAPMAAIWATYAVRRSRRTARAFATLESSQSDGLMLPASLHPVIDPSRCLGCATCVAACPEHQVLGLVRGKAQLVTPANCIGHGACREACPTGAISLVLGTAERGIDIPALSPDFQTNVPGIFVAGELGGMGLIRNGIEQGRQAVDAIAKRLARHPADPDAHEIAIVGAGPAGFSATLAAMQHGLRGITLEQETLGGTVAHYPRGKIVMTAPVELPLYGKVPLRETSKEALLDLWQEVAEQTGAQIRYSERVESIARDPDGHFVLESIRGRYRASCVLLAIGRRGTPRKLGVPGEDRNKVVYRLIDPEQYRGQRVLVVGGGDSALEAACSVAELPETEVTLSYRGESFDRAKAKNRSRVDQLREREALRVLLRSEVVEIGRRAVKLRTPSGEQSLENGAVIVCAGGILPTPFLESMGVRIETHHGKVMC